jgi:hypothetical protein
MTTQEVEQLIEGQTESPNLDFKADCPWDDKSFAKDFLAMSNIRDGGTILIGVQEEHGRFVPKGMSSANRNTYKIDIMRDQLAAFCDPSPEFRIEFPTDSAGREFVVIKIAPFRDLPLLSRKGIPGVILAHTLYYRNTNKRVESAPVSNSHDLRDIIERAARNLHRRLTDIGYKLDSGLEKVFEEDMSALPADGLLAKIKNTAYWAVEFRPAEGQKLLRLQELRQRVQDATVRLNWPLPYYSLMPNEHEGIKNLEGFIEGFVQHSFQFELWRFYLSGHFLLFRMLREDAGLLYPNDPTKGTFVNLFSSITDFVVEVFLFLQRLIAGGLYTAGVELRLALYNVKNRHLYLGDSRGAPLFRPRIADANTIRVSRSLTADAVKDDPIGLATGTVRDVLEYFHFDPPIDFIQRALTEHAKRNR